VTGNRPEGDSPGAVRWGVLSTARINNKVLAGARTAPNVDVVAVGSRDRERGEAFAAEHGIARVHGSYEDLLADPDIEAVYIPLPNSLHVPWSVKALEAGKHVLCEKPLTRRVADAEAAFDAAKRADRLLMEAFMWRYHPQTEALVRLLPEIAPLRIVRAAFGFTIGDDPANVRLQSDLEGGSLMDVGCYCVSALRLLAGEPERASGEAVLAPSGVDARFAAVLRLPGDVIGQFDCGLDVPPRGGIYVVGEGGTLIAEDPWHGQSPRLTRDGEDVPVKAANPYGLELEDFSAGIREGRPPRLGREDAVGQARAIEMLYASAGM
jgi:D-xylose 1-dehydrogenase (NADP+, D-xylono-1,5-lactone-forming)